MTEVVATSNFAHHGHKYAGDQFTVSPKIAEQLEQKGLVQILGDGPAAENPMPTAGDPLSASPAVPVSPEATVTPRKRGRPKKPNAD